MGWLGNVGTVISLISAILPIVNTVETMAKALPSLRGKSKEDAAVALLGDTPKIAEQLKDPDFEDAVRKLIQSYVALQNANAKTPGK